MRRVVGLIAGLLSAAPALAQLPPQHIASPLLVDSTLGVGGTGPITGFGMGVGQAPQWINWNGSGFPGWHQASRLVFDQPATTDNDFALFQLGRVTTFSSTNRNINNILRLSGNYGANDGTSEWGLTSVMTSAGNVGGETTAGFFQTNSSPGSTDFAITLIGDYRDLTNLGTAASGVSGTGPLELDLEVNSADDGNNGATFGGKGVRKGVNMVVFRKNTAITTQTEVSNGIWFTTATSPTVGPDPFTNYQSAIGFGVNTQIRNGLDTRGAITPAGSANPVSAVTMTAGHIVDFNGPTTITGTPRNYWWWDGATSKMKYNVGATTVLSVDNSGNVRALGTVTASVTP